MACDRVTRVCWRTGRVVHRRDGGGKERGSGKGKERFVSVSGNPGRNL